MSNKRFLYILLLIPVFILGSCSEDEPMPEVRSLTAEQSYFMEVALGSEFGNSTSKIRKWAENLKVFLVHENQAELSEELDLIIAEMNALISTIEVVRVNTIEEANFVAYLSDAETYTSYEPAATDYVDNNWGLVWIYWNGSHEIYRGSMYVDIFRNTDLNCMKHLLREEFTQGLGLLNDSYDYTNSIFYQRWTCTPFYAEVDEFVISTLYDDRIKSGMTFNQVRELLYTF